MGYTISVKKKVDTSSIDRLQNKINQLYDNSVNNGSSRMKRLQNKINNLHELEVDDYFETIKNKAISQTTTQTEIKKKGKIIMNNTTALNEKTAHWKLVYAATISASVLGIVLAIS